MIKQQHIVYLLFALFFAIGSFIVTDYGVGWDEDAQILIGQKSYDFILQKNNDLFTFNDRDYGVGFELPVYAAQQIFTTKASQYYFRHFCVHYLFLIGMFFFYKAELLLFKNHPQKYLLSLLGIIFIFFSPRIYADSFFNSKDLVLLSVSCINFFTLINAIEKPTKKNWIIHSISSAFLLNIRIIGMINAIISIAILVFKLFIDKENRKKWLENFLLFIPLTAIILYGIWPYLYIKPFIKFAEAFNHMKQFRWESNLLFMGKIINATKIPSYYSLYWIGITTPILYIILFFIGFFVCIKKIITKHFISTLLKNETIYILIILGLAIGPIFAVILFKSILYDGWRQLFYIYPYFILISILGVQFIFSFSNRLLKNSLYAIIALQIVSVFIFTVKSHPYENVYFNEIVSKKNNYLLKNYERDYWGVSYKQALLFLSKKIKTSKDTIRILGLTPPCKMNSAFIPEKISNQIITYKMDEMNDSLKKKINYVVYAYRCDTMPIPKCKKKIWSKVIQQSEVISIFDLSENTNCYE